MNEKFLQYNSERIKLAAQDQSVIIMVPLMYLNLKLTIETAESITHF